ncbi:beta galactosidase small subunit [Mucilaginibacter frigoritolerans]|uniref:beta-galactosidase n=1 Tax=Mucilaginibacter frigoritolerans TaxID=652788 RepID=A0A562UD69_9SPHI|nr:glycoside hydrolase family 2 TIM barrel-domain containing protein [Mucilaginibacter frigoritolerans]TWJ03185.1 beta galactosidase small subunit [Mucilaginibacter frigoritolerans]
MKRAFISAFSLLLAFTFTQSHAQATQKVYLSGTDKDHTVNWDFFINTGQKSGAWSKIAVPSNWELQGFGTYNYFQDTQNPEEQGIYKYHFNSPAAWLNKKTFIVFEGAMTDTKVMINGQLAGPIHQGGYYRFKYDISNLIKAGDNLLEVTVSKKSANASINLAERRADFWQFGGIFRPVYLEVVPQNYIDHITSDAKADGSIKVDVYAPNVTADNVITAQLLTLAGQKIGKELSIAAVAGQPAISLRGSFEGVIPWNPEFPKLYNLIVSIKDRDGRIIHTIMQRIGFRTMELRLHDGIYVNGKKVILKGVNRHSEWPESGRTLSKDISITDVNLMKDMNMNAVRMSHYPPDQHFLDVCDSLGLFVLDELTGWQNKYDTIIGKKLVKEMVVRDVNHPSIIFWDNGNEGGWNTALDDQFKLYDPQNRVVLHPWEKFNGTDTRHYPDYNYVVNSALYGNDVFFPTEFMHGNYDGGAAAGLEDFWNAILKHPYGAGGFIWVFADGGIRRVDKDSTMDTANDSAPDGILGPHREKEGSYYTIKELWSPVVIDRKIITPQFDGRIAVENRYSYTNLNQCRFKWQLVNFPAAGDTATGAITGAQYDLPDFNLAPGEKGLLQLKLPENWANYDALYLTATDPHGRELFTWTWPIKLPDQIKKPDIHWTASKTSTEESASSLIVNASGIKYFFNKTNGQLQKVINSKGEISLTGPVEAGISHNLVQLKSYAEGANFIVEPVYEGSTYFNVKWIFAPGKAVELQYQYTLEKHWSQQTGVDFAGITFNYPEEKITGMKWLGRGPYRVWKNRMKGQQFGVWHKNYNNTITGASWNYPEFKGYHADLYWAVIENKESPFTVYTDDQSIFLQMLKPDHSKYEHESLKAAFPEGDIGFLNSIAPIGTRFQNPALLGPQSQKNIQLNYSIVKGTLWFDFR